MIVPQGATSGAATAREAPTHPSPGETSDRVFTGHRVSTPVFAGPVDLLIYLVESGEIDILQIAIRTITSQYVDYVAGLDSLDIELVGEFMVMAAQLMEIKSRTLLPQEERPEDDEEEVGDPTAQLLARLIEYRRYKVVAEELRERAEVQRWVFSRALLGDGDGNGQAEHAYLMLNDVSPFDLWAAFQSVLNRARQAPAGGEVVRARFTVAQKMALIATRLRWAKSGMRFAELFADDSTLMELIVTFLALLELIRLRRVRVAQERLFGEIWVYRRATSSLGGAGLEPSGAERRAEEE
jgi:segregation and condensation protein A